MSQSTPGVLERILARTRERVFEQRRVFPLERMQRSAPTPTGRRPFLPAIARPGQINVIAEFKRRSPSRGVIREDLHPMQVAQAYEVGGAAALSVLTEEQFFGGSMDDLKDARAATLLPALRKDFVIDPYQVWEAWYAGADAVLLIVAALSDAELKALHQTAQEAGLDTLVEVHDRVELERALTAGARAIGVNNRDLRTMEVRLENALELARFIPAGIVAVAESGIRGPGDIRRLREAGYDAYLIGETLMTGQDPRATLETLIRDSSTPRWAGRAARKGTKVAVKICGITTVEDGVAAARAGADAIGFVFVPGSPRCVTVETARAISRALPPFVLRVGVFADLPPSEVERIAAAVALDIVQLHGDETPEEVAGFQRRAIKAVPVDEQFTAADALRFEGQASGILLDTRATPGGVTGGTGRTFDWARAREVRERASFLVLAGGLTPENVGVALTAVRPDAVDVSSGVESSPGRKDADKVRAFIHAVRNSR
jgi:indole-3-glycerol phosphate synthase / phosphoribosylanthranilate isomerase